ncbi:DNA recombination protein RmuC [Schumannella sp. 10F1B-5-1]|uniref:DNA recombination protein RmuC n=1 Tax=Schumannella sp. 10F1B-5-1 TaxID=2590780 RepID=UPI001130757A|nr:DNA recombination protein RmuC [Schumannella sp. 10F1B-5-1]TPW73095.1 DNA recombination protein RmuC [Schumannella sp. 10F1B-5-1]
MDPLSLLIGLILGLVVGAVAAALLLRSRRTAESTVDAPVENPELVAARHARELDAVRAEEAGRRGELNAELSGVRASLEAAREALAGQERQFRDLIERTEAERRERAHREQTDAASESKVLQALSPVQESLRTMQSKVAELEQQRSREHGELTRQLTSAAESEERLRRTADSLASALRNNATRGVWGETQLRSVVEAAGMLEHVNFDVQASVQIDNRTARPDMVVHLPGGKNIAVDSKVPFNSYLEASAIDAGAGDAELARREALLKQHVKAVRDHITTLGGKSYWDGLEASPEMVVAFIPSESLLSAALEADPTIMEFAFSKHVALASPVTLFSVLKAVAVSWRHEVVTQEARALFDVSRELYGRITTLAGRVDKLGRSIERSVKDYNAFVGSLERQVLPSAKRLSQLDEAKVLPALKEIDEDTRQVTASALTDQIAEEQRLALAGTGHEELDLGLAGSTPRDDTADDEDERRSA